MCFNVWGIWQVHSHASKSRICGYLSPDSSDARARCWFKLSDIGAGTLCWGMAGKVEGHAQVCLFGIVRDSWTLLGRLGHGSAGKLSHGNSVNAVQFSWDKFTTAIMVTRTMPIGIFIGNVIVYIADFSKESYRFNVEQPWRLWTSMHSVQMVWWCMRPRNPRELIRGIQAQSPTIQLRQQFTIPLPILGSGWGERIARSASDARRERTSPGDQAPSATSTWFPLIRVSGVINRKHRSGPVESTRCATTWPVRLCRYAQTLPFGDRGQSV